MPPPSKLSSNRKTLQPRTKTSRSGTTDDDPTLSKVQASLRQNVDFFLSHISDLIERYNRLMEEAKPPQQQQQQQGGSVQITPTFPSDPAEKKDIGGSSSSPSSSSAPNTGVVDAPPTAATPSVAIHPPTATAATAEELHNNHNNNNNVLLNGSTTTVTVNAVDEDDDNDEDTDVVYIRFPDNSALIRQLQTIKQEAYELSTTYDGIHDWIVLNVPEITEEDSTGVEIMSAVMEQINTLNAGVRSVYKFESNYFEERANIEKAILKMPECNTLHLELVVNEEETWVELNRAWRTMIRSSLILYTMLSKNMSKLEEPTSRSVAASHYFQ